MKTVQGWAMGVLVLMLMLPCAWARADVVLKVWHFKGAQGDVVFTVSTFPATPHQVTLSIDPQPGTSPSVLELRGMLAKVLAALPALGHPPSELAGISIPMDQSPYATGLLQAIDRSGAWKHDCIRAMHCFPAYPVAQSYLRSVHAFGAFDAVLRRYHDIHGVDVSVDPMGCDVKKGKLRCSGLIQLSIAWQYRPASVRR